MENVKIDKIVVFAKMAVELSSLSKDPFTKVGAIILRPDFSICSGGYNGLPKGYPDTPETWNNRELKNKIVKHAEENAISFSQDPTLKGYSIVVTHFPCPTCAGDMIQKGISEVYYINDPRVDHNCELTMDLFNKIGIKYTQIKIIP